MGDQNNVEKEEQPDRIPGPAVSTHLQHKEKEAAEIIYSTQRTSTVKKHVRVKSWLAKTIDWTVAGALRSR